MKKILSLYLLTFFLHSVSAQEKTKVLTLKQCIETAIANNLDVRQSELQMQTDEINWKQSRLDLLPNLNGNASQGINKGRSIDPFTNTFSNQQISYGNYGLNSGVLLFNGFTAQNTIKQNSFAYQASQMDWQQSKDNITINVILAYLEVLANEELLQQARSQAELTKKQVERLEVLNREGATSPPFVFDLRGQYADDQLAIINTQSALETAKINLARLLNVPYDKNIQVEKLDAIELLTTYGTTSTTIYQTALEQFSQIKAVGFRKLSAEKAVKVARGRLYPFLSLNGSVNTNYSSAATQSTFINTTDITTTDYVLVNGSPTQVIRKQNNFSTARINYGSQLNNNLYSSVSLNLTIPIFNSWQARNRIKLAQINLKNSVLTESTAKTALQQSIEQAYSNMIAAYDRYKTLLEQVNAYLESFRAAEIRFNNGVGNSIDYLTAKNNLERARANLISARYDYILRTRVLDYYQGK